jgi:PAS domain S-box-containing protein
MTPSRGTNTSSANQIQSLRRRADAILRKKAPQAPEEFDSMKPAEIRQMLHDLQVSQIELQLQNEELQRAQSDAEVSRTRYFELYHLAPVGYCTLHAQGSILEANFTAATLLGLPRGELLKLPFSRFIFNEDQDIYYLHRKKLLETGSQQSCELRMVKHNGSQFWAHLESTVRRSATHETEIHCMLNDVTASRQDQLLLAWEKDALEWIVPAKSLSEILDGLMLGLEKQTPDALCSVLLLDEDGVHLRHGAAPSLPDAYNRAINGITIGPAVGSCGTAAYENRQVIVSDIGHDPLWANFRELALKNGLRACWSTPLHSRHGKTLGTFAVYYHEPRQPTAAEMEVIERATHIVSIAIERAHDEEEIRKFNAELEQRVNERTMELQATNEELESFSYSVSHDLRAPLRAMDGFSRMVLTDCAERLDDNGRRMLGVIHSEAQRMGQLIDDLLAFSRLNRQPIEPTRINMAGIAREVFEELAAASPERKLHLNLHPLPPARGAEAMIRQVWVNLISNAIKFTRDRKIGEIEINTRKNDPNEIIYYVKDNGAGFEMRHAEKLFGVFQRLHNQQEFPGTGIGLALVKRIIQRHGGRVWAEAEIDRGATFYFTLPNSK